MEQFQTEKKQICMINNSGVVYSDFDIPISIFMKPSLLYQSTQVISFTKEKVVANCFFGNIMKTWQWLPESLQAKFKQDIIRDSSSTSEHEGIECNVKRMFQGVLVYD